MMKNYLAGLLLIMVTISCTEKKGNETQVVNYDYISKPIGVKDKEEYRITASDTLVKNWELHIKEIFEISDAFSFTKFEIVKAVTDGDTKEDCYLLLTHTPENHSTIALILDLKDDEFYLNTKVRNMAVSQVILCKGKSDCSPMVILHDKQKRLICPEIDDCEKIIGEIVW